ncbi:hypothetical protein CCACVL1_14753 [Corchorus capsularis]|uniref:Uncharacterized protein n=1 Tax=Corchorus capsularis TaxID=210143 RepID=A0A1R3I5N2_COCAP|nr:hypothetical protein CCACVL1_14753 [Corchorus capsularis]
MEEERGRDEGFRLLRRLLFSS